MSVQDPAKALQSPDHSAHPRPALEAAPPRICAPYDLADTIDEAVRQLREAADLLSTAARLLTTAVPTDDEGQGIDRLSRQELRVALFIAQGRTNQQISRSLGISLNTVKNHNKRILAKLGLRSRTEVAVAVHRVPPPRQSGPDDHA